MLRCKTQQRADELHIFRMIKYEYVTKNDENDVVHNSAKKKYFSFPVDNLTVETEWCVSMEKEK